MRKFFSKNKKTIISFSIILMLIFVFFFYPQTTYADIDTAVAKVLGWIIYPFIWIFGKLAILFLDMLIGVAQYNNFIHSSAVTYGWIVVRDLCNMFFVLILLIIAFASILRIESYNLKTWLPKLVIMAVLINFSKLICGFLIDFTQVVMLTFINAIKDIAGTNLTDMLGISKILTASKENGGDIGFMSIIGSMILALVIVIIATVVILTMLVMLVMRMIMIWIYVVLSPLAYLLASFPQGQQYSQRWWSDFSKNLIIGPVLAFFLWLSFASLGGLNSKKDIDDMKKNNSFSESLDSGATSSAEIAAASTEAGSKDNMILFVVSIGMLLGGMMIAQEMGGQAGKIVGKGMGKLQAMGAGFLKMGKRVTGIERAENAYKSYKQRKDSKRQELAQRDAGVINALEGRVAKAVIAKPAQNIGNLITKPFRAIAGVSEKKIKEKEENIKQREKERDELKGMVDIGGEIKMIQDKENSARSSAEVSVLESERTVKMNELEREWHANYGNRSEQRRIEDEMDTTNKQYQKRIDDKVIEIAETGEDRGKILNNYKKVTDDDVGGDLSKIDIDKFNDKKEDVMAAKGKEIESDHRDLSESRKKVEKINKWSAVIAGGALGTLLGGPLGTVAGVAGGAYGAIAGGAARNILINAGSDSLDLASNYNSSQISKEKDKLKGLKEEELRAVKDDYSQDSPARTAATMLLLERKELSQEEAKIERDKIVGAYSYDGRVLDQLDASLASNYQQLSRLFTDLHSTAAPKTGPDNRSNEIKEKHEKTKEKITRNIVDQKISINSIDDQESLDLIMPKLSEDMTDGNFINMYDRQTNDKQDQIELALKRSATFKADNKLSIINKSTKPIKDADLGKYFKKAKFFQFQDLSNSIKGLESIKEAFSRYGKLAELKSATGLEDFRKKINKITEKCQFDESPQQRGVLKKIWEKVNS